jgi:Flp pilus assembly CpaE family ATPase
MIQQTGNKILAYADDIVIMVQGNIECLKNVLT